MRVLLDENMPESVRSALLELGHEVDSIASLQLKGLENSRLYREVAQSYDLCLTKDRQFVEMVRAIDRPGSVKVIRVTIAQAPAQRYGSDWPSPA